MAAHRKKPEPEERVLLLGLPSRFLDGLPRQDQRAISRVVGKPVRLVKYERDGRAELEFVEKNGTSHSIWIRQISRNE